MSVATVRLSVRSSRIATSMSGLPVIRGQYPADLADGDKMQAEFVQSIDRVECSAGIHAPIEWIEAVPWKIGGDTSIAV